MSSVRCSTGKGDQATVVLTHASGSSAEVYVFGATLSSYKFKGNEVIFVSEKAIFNGAKAIRGGVPLVFPQFGQPDKAMAQHGFLRTSAWEVVPEQCEVRGDGVVQAVLRLVTSDATRAVWPHEFKAEYVIALGADSLRTSLRTTNLDTADAVCPQLLLHTYYNLPDILTARLVGLQGSKYLDKSPTDGDKDALRPFDEPALSFERETDKVFYTGSGVAAGAKSLVMQLCGVPGATHVEIAAHAAYCERSTGGLPLTVQQVTPDCVVWNQWEEKAKAMADFGDDEWKRYVCVEPGLLGENRPKVPAGHSVELSQTITPKF
eukprot:gnl/TRDRNA2_/TRDRNA2_42612_c0_seq1.p1 gnl/TRDRNA2_/TRDRNA2_42612_c0~~gnl/TRDRNA2_/TRDRNA2_42612_c0_seq1.p1  ORF type:complete len:320 (+),score=63.06 gnl/TRDRNA2_/TRDRNA2_42612_c0_seq1:67-1026(+)